MYGVDTVVDENGFEIAVIGMAGRFPGGSTYEALQHADEI